MPREALREAVLNAVVHRTYETGNPIQIKVFDDKVYVYNDARLPAGITEKDLQLAHKSTPYNPMIANAFFRSGQIEAWGRGIEKIKAACAADNLPEPEFRVTPTEFMICFHIRDNNRAIAGRFTDDEKNIVPNGTINGGLNGGLNETQKNIIKLFIENPEIKAQTIADLLGFTKRKVEYHINQIKKVGRLKREGSKKNGRWIVKHENEDLDFL
jgi:ATP-dependent DNA helicase RecG